MLVGVPLFLVACQLAPSMYWETGAQQACRPQNDCRRGCCADLGVVRGSCGKYYRRRRRRGGGGHTKPRCWEMATVFVYQLTSVGPRCRLPLDESDPARLPKLIPVGILDARRCAFFGCVPTCSIDVLGNRRTQQACRPQNDCRRGCCADPSNPYRRRWGGRWLRGIPERMGQHFDLYHKHAYYGGVLRPIEQFAKTARATSGSHLHTSC